MEIIMWVIMAVVLAWGIRNLAVPIIAARRIVKVAKANPDLTVAECAQRVVERRKN